MVRVTIERRRTSAKRSYYYLVCSRTTLSGRRRKVIATGTTHKSVAVARQKELELRIATGYDPWQPKPETLTLSEAGKRFIEDCEARGLRPATIETYRGVIRQFTNEAGPDVSVADVKTSDVRAFAVQSHLAPSSRHHRLNHVKTFFSWAVRSGLAESNPADNANIQRAKKQTPKFITPADFERILTALDYSLSKPGPFPRNQRAAYWLKPMVQTAYNLGLRRGEVIRLTWRDINLEDGTVSIKLSKGGDRHLPMPAGLVDVLCDWYDVTGPDGHVFVTSRGTPPESDYVGRSFRRICKLAGVSTGAFHALRHGTATALLTAGASARDVQAILGHAKITTTEKYLHIIDGRLRGLLDTTFSKPR